MKGTILVVDDNPKNLEVLIHILEEDGYDVRAIRKSSTVLSSLQVKKPDLILLDIIMPELNGYEICEEIKSNSNFRDIPILFISALNETANKVEAFQKGGVDYITKPFQQEEVLARVNTHLNLYKLSSNLQQRVQEEIHKQKAQEQLLMQQDKMATIGNLLSMIVHQWKQPLNTISMLSDLIINHEEFDYHETMILAGQILEQVHFMNETMEDFKNFLKPTKEKVEFYSCEEIETITRMFSDTLIKNKIKVRIQAHEHFKTLGYSNEFKQVILNLFGNSIDAFNERNIEENREIFCYFNKKEKFNVIRISDNAGGIDENYLPDKIFESSFTTKGNKGTGIGLQIAKTIIEERLGGKIYAQNILGGVEFVIELPVVKP